jgi:hypothetical protein
VATWSCSVRTISVTNHQSVALLRCGALRFVRYAEGASSSAKARTGKEAAPTMRGGTAKKRNPSLGSRPRLHSARR